MMTQSNLNISSRFTLVIFLLICLNIGFLNNAQAVETPALKLAPVAEVTGNGVFLQQVVTCDQTLPTLRLCDAPQVGKTLDLTRDQINDLLAAKAPDFTTTNWIGANSVHILRRNRTLNEADAITLLTATLQQNYVKDRGELELSFTQPWDAPILPDEPLRVKILELPTAGVTPSFIARFQLCTATETVGTWEVTLRAHIWRDAWVAHSDLQRGELIADADLTRDRRDVLSTHESLADFSAGDSTLELADSVPVNNMLLAHDVKLRNVIHRGQIADALLEKGSLNIMMKVEAMQDGAPGEIIHARNTVSQHDLTGKVLDDHTIIITL
jgi:flagella basal body P-ring formation protein FlgA